MIKYTIQKKKGILIINKKKWNLKSTWPLDNTEIERG